MDIVSRLSEKALWTAIIVTGVTAAWYIPRFLNHIKDLTVVSTPQIQPEEPRLQQDAEASIKTQTLGVLAAGPNYNLAAAAIKLAAARFVDDKGARRDLLRDLSSKEWHRRDRAINALHLLLTHPALKDLNLRRYFLDDDSFSAFVAALVHLLPEHEHVAVKDGDFPSPIRPLYRPVQERSILELLLILLEDPNFYDDFCAVDAQPAVNAGIITKWLAHYPFPCTLSQNRRLNFKSRDVCRLLEPDIWGSDDPKMAKLVAILVRLPSGARQLTDVGLRPRSHGRGNIGSREWATRSHPTLSSPDSSPLPLGTAIDGTNDDNNVGHHINEFVERMEPSEQDTLARRRSAVTPGERSRQRRHRQAIVVAEAGMPLLPENILQRQPTETELTWQQQEVRNRQGEILRNRRRSQNADVEVSSHLFEQSARERIDGLQEAASGFPTYQLPDLDQITSDNFLQESPNSNHDVHENFDPE